MVEYQHNDIVRLKENKFAGLKGKLWFKDNAFVISEVMSKRIRGRFFDPFLINGF